MKIVNGSPLAAWVGVAADEGTCERRGLVVAKATYAFEPTGEIHADLESTRPILFSDEETELGVVPRDDLPRHDDAFEVIVLGSAYAGSSPLTHRTVSLSVAEHRRELAVFGDRSWVPGRFRGWSISSPEPFERMPLSYRHAFGGSCEMLIDVESPLKVQHPYNPEGRGFDPSKIAKAFAQRFRPPKGFPQYEDDLRLPNIEDPQALIRDRGEEPLPICWATLPLASPIHVARGVDLSRAESNPMESMPTQEALFHRAHPDWVLPSIPEAAEIAMDGLTKEGTCRFRLPALRVFADYVLGDRHGRLELIPQMLILLPDEGIFTLLFKKTFAFDFEEEVERGMRLRVEEGWYRPQPEEALTCK